MFQRMTTANSYPGKALANGLIVTLLSMLSMQLSASAEVSTSAQTDASKLQGKVVHIEQTPSSGGDKTSGEKDVTFSTLSQDGIGNGVKVPLSEGKEGSDKAGAFSGKAETATIDIPLPGKRIDGKAEEAVSTAEMGVDWTSWANALADRWFQNLKNMEIRSGRYFRTTRPALIKYTCHRNGLISGIVLYRSCGEPKYDTMQIESLKRVTPLPPFPEGSKRVTYTLLQGWEAHPRKPGETDFQPGSFGKNIPIERVKQHTKIR